jgi:hypothetical protein
VDRVALALPSGQDLPALVSYFTGMATQVLAPWFGFAIGVALLAWVLSKPEGRTGELWLGGAGIGGVVVAMWWVSGRLGYLAEDPTTLQEAFLATNSHRMEAISMAAPLGFAIDWLMFFSDTSNTLTIGIVSVAGVIVGSSVVSLITRTFRWEGFGNAEDTGNHIAGSALMGIGGVTALGCTIGQGISGVSTLSLGSMLALLGIVGGAVLSLRYQQWRLDRSV